MRIKSRKQRESEYADLYGDISFDKYERLKNKLGNKLNENLLKNVYDRLDEASEREYTDLRFIFYEIPIQAHRPRADFRRHGLYMPNAKENYDAIEKYISEIGEDIRVISSPMKINITAYYPMPSDVNPIDMVIYETENDYAIGKPDFDNVIKAYCDMIQKHIILDDDLVVSSSFNKFFSLKPRVIMDIIYPSGVISDHTYKIITKRKEYENCKNRIDVELIVTPYRKK